MEQGELGLTLQTSSEGDRQRYGSKVNSEQLCRGPVLERETRNEEYLRRGIQ